MNRYGFCTFFLAARPFDSATDRVLPWTALLLGLWIPNLYYWGLNQYITQRTLGSASLAEGQRGIVFAATMKLVLPLGIVIPGLIAFNLYANFVLNAHIQVDCYRFGRCCNLNCWGACCDQCSW